ncbi:EAL domain-containing protein [Halioxenophilus aromaticivorans]|uniref:Protein-glutamate O-methyltransferase n=1 Tax=Halioxenophilus aromaticivorans TaxID=1306992 RepID=A0AAV3U1E4_9ALTE
MAEHKPVPLVGVGASAGGLEPTKQFLSVLRPDIKFAVVVLQHMSPKHTTLLPDLLARETLLVVEPIKNRTKPVPGRVYVVPPNRNAVFRYGRIMLMDPPQERTPLPCINAFFKSLAEEQPEISVGVVLSGTGNDGSDGLKALHDAGGQCFIQEPGSAKYSGMPLSAQEMELTDNILPPEEIAYRLMETTDNYVVDADASYNGSDLNQIIECINTLGQVDLTGYKPGTISRRVRRRMVHLGIEEISAYVDFLKVNENEVEKLSNDLLVSVTSFFRDRAAFNVLRKSLETLVDKVKDEDDIRVWVAGCATGEEAYSLTILFKEIMRDADLSGVSLSIFASDLLEDALEIARKGVYSEEAIKALPEKYQTRYFRSLKDGYYIVNKEIRDCVIFTRHNMLDDPPFLHMDLITCRNVLIYLESFLQNKALNRFHYSLKDHGLLFLGKSESIAVVDKLYKPIDAKARVFEKALTNTVQKENFAVRRKPKKDKSKSYPPEVLLRAVTKHFNAAAAMMNKDGDISQVSGAADEYLMLRQGRRTHNVIEAIIPELKSVVLTALYKLNKSTEVQEYGPIPVGDKHCRVSLSHPNSRLDDQVLLLITDANPPDLLVKGESDENSYNNELSATREQLHTLIEELATANEEMQSLNEEAQASNEELQAANEEMEATNEELQATNEELLSLNEQLNAKTRELTKLNNEYQHLYDSFEAAFLMVDRKLNITRMNFGARKLYSINGNYSMVQITQLNAPPYLRGLINLIEGVIETKNKAEKYISTDNSAYKIVLNPALNDSDEVAFIAVTITDVSNVREIEQKLYESENKLQLIMQNTTVQIAMKTMAGKYQFANKAFIKEFNIDSNDYIDKTDFDLFPDTYASDVWSNDLRALASLDVVESESRLNTSASNKIYRTRRQVLRNASGKPASIITETEDITDKKMVEDKLKIAAQVYQQAGEAIVVADLQRTITSINDAFTVITGYLPDEVIGKSMDVLFSTGSSSEVIYRKALERINDVGQWQGEIECQRKNGDKYPEWITINEIADGDGKRQYYIAVFSDISNLKDSQRKVEFLATHDSLTGLPNRSLFMDRLQNSLARYERGGGTVSVMFIDLDDFKSINDTLGHDVGDVLLRGVSEKLSGLVRTLDTVARFGGDEFTVLINDLNVADVNSIAERILEVLSDPIDAGVRKIFASASIGISVFPDDESTALGLLKNADTAMYRAKELGRNQYQFFHEEMRATLVRQSDLESSLRYGLRQNQFRLVLQPQYATSDSSKLVGAEALLRWHDPVLGNIAPTEFIPLAENNGNILELTNFVCETIISLAARWHNLGYAIPTLAFNVSARVIQREDFVSQLIKIIQRYQVPANYFKIEVTEGAMMDRGPIAKQNLETLRENGFGIAVDDFGTGYSSLVYLKNLPLCEVKIDKDFVDGLGTDESDESICLAILSLAKALKMSVVAEGVETQQQLDWLTTNSCDHVQGFLFNKPLEISDFERLIQ